MPRIRQHLAYVSRKGTPNPCYEALKQAGVHEKGGHTTTIPSQFHGLNRVDTIQAEGPQLPPGYYNQRVCEKTRADITKLQEQLDLETPTQAELQEPEVQRFISLLTEHTIEWTRQAEEERATPSMAITEVWLLTMEEVDLLPQVMRWVFCQWGQQQLRTIVEEHSEGITEVALEAAFEEMQADSQCYTLRSQIDQLEARLRAQQAGQTQQPHRPVKWGPSSQAGSRKQIRRIDDTSLGGFLEQERYNQQIMEVTITEEGKYKTMPLVRQLQAKPTFIILHLFSGRRRKEDFHDQLVELTKAEEFCCHVLSLDVAIDENIGNLEARSTTWAKVETLLGEGKIAGALSGAPCNTWSEARHNPPPQEQPQPERRWPRPLRSEEAPWGLPGLTKRGMEALAMGTRFSLQTLYVMVMLLINGGIMASEHPGIPQKAGRASVWKLPIVHLLQQFEAIRLYHVWQGLFGASSWKRTGLLTLRMRRFEATMRRFQQQPEQPMEMAVGKNPETGEFRTACLKEYPARFSGALACSFREQLVDHFKSGKVFCTDPGSHADWLRAAHVATSRIVQSATMRPDLFFS